MSKPILFVVAGCNGSGKSTYSKSLLPEHITIFDADKLKKKNYDSFTFDFELRDTMAWNMTYEALDKEIEHAIKHKTHFAYETNFNHEPLHLVQKFKDAGYAIHLIFFCLKSIELAIERVAIRFENGGHYVTDKEVETRYVDGFLNLDNHYTAFDTILIVESSAENQKPLTLYTSNSLLKIIDRKFPLYFKKRCPNLYAHIHSHKP